MKDVSYEILDLMDEYGSGEEGIRKILESRKEPELLMALSAVRENLVDWMEISKEDRVLEIGSDYGALTGILAWKAKEVVVLDSRVENLEVNKRRHPDFENITWECREAGDGGSAGIFLEGQEFDWVFLIGPKTREASLGIGVREDNWNFQEEKAYGAEQIRRAASMVKKGGHLVAAVPNARGLKLWAGGEPDKDELSFTLEELKQIFESLGGGAKFYYPLPDYKLPSAVYSDDYLPAKGEIPNLFAEYEKPRYRLFSEEGAYDMLCEAGSFPQFANSYLVCWEKR
ncbi:MAG: hypothetical protein Q4F29_01645 [Lachnospiraceae bacterium]|nr:hypothetical protein [Lachnospiraceae bacterium]